MTHHTTLHDLMRPGEATDFFARRPFPPFDPDAVLYSGANALWLAEISRLTYRHDIGEDPGPPQPLRSSFLKSRGLRQRRFFCSTVTGTQALLVESDGLRRFAVLAFRGTKQSPQDFIADVLTGLPPLVEESISVHVGFHIALDSVWDEISSELSMLTCPVYFTGHSLGAALATLAAARHPPRAAYTFGSPRVGNQAFARSLQNVPIYRVVDDQDAVTWVPPEALGYHHVGSLQVLHEPVAAAGAELIERLEELVHLPKIFADHAPVNYVDRIPLAPAC